MEVLNIIGSVSSIIGFIISLFTLTSVLKISDISNQKNMGKDNINIYHRNQK